MFDIVVIGAGIAGISAAAELSASAKVAVIEAEPHPGFHATGRSAAFFAKSYGPEAVRAITSASEIFYRNPPADFSEVQLLKPRNALFIARADQQEQLSQMSIEIPSLQAVSAGEICSMVPIIKRSYVDSGLRDVDGGDLEVDAILQGYLRLFKRRGGQLLCDHQLTHLEFSAGCWTLHIGKQVLKSPVIVNAAGAWAGDVARLAGLTDLDLQPKRRTALLIRPPQELSMHDWPLVIDIDEKFYFKPDAGQILISPADETPCDPCDAQADELDVAIAVDRFEKATSVQVQRVTHKWAGLRTFAKDKVFVVGFDPRAEGFFWLAGQGGYGVQSAPGVAQLTNRLVANATLSAVFESIWAYRDAVSPDRLL